jgi:hypothetical protein
MNDSAQNYTQNKGHTTHNEYNATTLQLKLYKLIKY